MLLLVADALLLISLSTMLGILFQYGLEKIFRVAIESDVFGIFLAGLILSTCYFNIISFWLPVNYLSLIPLSIIGLWGLRQFRTGCLPIFQALRRQVKTLFSLPFLLPTASLIFLVVCYWFLLPSNGDRAYHYQSILWYEKFKTVPGLANVHGRFAYNPGAFIIQSAYSFTSLTGQSIYPLNGVITGLFLLWILARMLRYRRSFTGLIYLLLFVMLSRHMLINCSSATSDLLALVCVCYPLIRLFEILLEGDITLPKALIPFLIAIYAPVAKLSAFPILVILPAILYLLPATVKKRTLTLGLFSISLLIYLPWIGRNFILSGYLAYPIPYLDFFKPDWKVPKDVLMVDFFYTKYLPKFDLSSMGPIDREKLQSVSFRDWFLPWISMHFKNKNATDLFIFLAAAFSPVCWIFIYSRKAKPALKVFLFWLSIYICVWAWLFTSPDARFGLAFMAPAIIFPLLAATFLKTTTLSKTRISLKTSSRRGWVSMLFVLLLIAYMLRYLSEAYGFNKNALAANKPAFSLKGCWLYPVRDHGEPFRKPDFPYKVINHGVKLYLSDSTHECENANLPCMSWKYGEIEMRGNRLDDGFRNIKNEVWKNFPSFLMK